MSLLKKEKLSTSSATTSRFPSLSYPRVYESTETETEKRKTWTKMSKAVHAEVQRGSTDLLDFQEEPTTLTSSKDLENLSPSAREGLTDVR